MRVYVLLITLLGCFYLPCDLDALANPISAELVTTTEMKFDGRAPRPSPVPYSEVLNFSPVLLSPRDGVFRCLDKAIQ